MTNILILPTSYPNIYNKHASIFVQDQAMALSKQKNLSVRVVGAIPISFKEILKKKLFKFGLFHHEKHNVCVTLFLFPAIPKLRRINNYIRFLLNKKLLKAELEHTIDIVHVHNAVAAEAALWLQTKTNIPYCITEHSSAYARGLLKHYEITKYAKAYQKSFCNIAVSVDLCTLLQRLYDVNVTYIPNIVDTEFFTPAKNRSKALHFITVANLNRNKNISLIIRAFSQAFPHNSEITLSIVGDGPEYKSLQKIIKNLQLQHQITLYGVASRDEVLQELQRSHAFVLSSHYETFGVVLIEAMSCGLPVISTRSGGPESIITSDKLGILVDNNSVDALARAMKKIHHHHYNNNVIRHHVIETFSQQKVAAKLSEIYSFMLQRADKNLNEFKL